MMRSSQILRLALIAEALMSRTAQAKLPVVIDRLSTPVCKVLLKIDPGIAWKLNELAPNATNTAIEKKIESEFAVLKDPKKAERNRERALDNVLTMKGETREYVSNKKLQNYFIRNLRELRLSLQMADKIDNWFARNADENARGELLSVLKYPLSFKDGTALLVARRMLLELSLNYGFTAEIVSYLDSLTVVDQLSLAQASGNSRYKARMVWGLQFRLNYDLVRSLLPSPKENHGVSDYAALWAYVRTDLGIDGGLGYYNQAIMTRLMEVELLDTNRFSQPLVAELYALIRHRLANGLLFRDEGRQTPEVRLTYPAAITIVALVSYAMENPIIWTPAFRTEFLRMTNVLERSNEARRAFEFLSAYAPGVAHLLSATRESALDKGLQTRGSIVDDLSLRSFSFAQFAESFVPFKANINRLPIGFAEEHPELAPVFRLLSREATRYRREGRYTFYIDFSVGNHRGTLIVMIEPYVTRIQLDSPNQSSLDTVFRNLNWTSVSQSLLGLSRSPRGIAELTLKAGDETLAFLKNFQEVLAAMNSLPK